MTPKGIRRKISAMRTRLIIGCWIMGGAAGAAGHFHGSAGLGLFWCVLAGAGAAALSGVVGGLIGGAARAVYNHFQDEDSRRAAAEADPVTGMALGSLAGSFLGFAFAAAFGFLAKAATASAMGAAAGALLGVWFGRLSEILLRMQAEFSSREEEESRDEFK